jgi:hypothetical protein
MFGMDVSPTFFPDNVYFSIETTTYSLSVATTVLSTLIISGRILKVSHMAGISSQPRTVLEIIVESAALYSIAALGFISLMGVSDPNVGTYSLYMQLFFTNMAVRVSVFEHVRSS